MSYILELQREFHMKKEYLFSHLGFEFGRKDNIAQTRIKTTLNQAWIWGIDAFSVQG